MVKIAFQGELGAYSHIAAKELFNDSEIKACATFEFMKAKDWNSSLGSGNPFNPTELKINPASSFLTPRRPLAIFDQVNPGRK